MSKKNNALEGGWNTDDRNLQEKGKIEVNGRGINYRKNY